MIILYFTFEQIYINIYLFIYFNTLYVNLFLQRYTFKVKSITRSILYLLNLSHASKKEFNPNMVS